MYLEKEDSTPTPKSVVETQILQGNIYYVRLWAEMDADLQGAGTAPSTVELVRQAVQQANGQGCIGMILDIRNNMGGLDEMAADILGSFIRPGAFTNTRMPMTRIRKSGYWVPLTIRQVRSACISNLHRSSLPDPSLP